VLLGVAVLALALDAISKIIVVARLTDREPIELLGGLLTLRVTRNSGAAFSIATGLTVVLTLIAIGVVIAILRTARRLRSLPWAISLGLLLGGATGNLVDRLFRSPSPLKGHVVDWIELPNWPVFNLADSAIVCGGVLAVVLASRGLQLDGTRVSDAEPDSGADSGPETGAETAPEASEVSEVSEHPPEATSAGGVGPDGEDDRPPRAGTGADSEPAPEPATAAPASEPRGAEALPEAGSKSGDGGPAAGRPAEGTS
jgi:signal peptidase II